MIQLHRFARRHALYASALLGVAASALFAARVAQTGSLVFLFLPFNLALGWIPLLFALAHVAADRLGSRALSAGLVLPWLLFLPNSVYLVTDLVHLRSRPGVPHVFDSTLCALFAGAGVLAGVSALSMVEESFRARHGAPRTAVALVFTLFLNGLGVYIGRYLRWNSWDVLRDPAGILVDVWTRMIQPSPHLWTTTAVYALLLGICWVAFVTVRGPALLVSKNPLAQSRHKRYAPKTIPEGHGSGHLLEGRSR